MIEKLKKFIGFILYYFIDLFIKPSQEIKPKSILLIRLDSIGDYVLFRNYIEILKRHKKFNQYSITFLGNNAWKSISQEWDSKYIDKFIWLDRSKFARNLGYRYKKLKEIVSQGYDVVLNTAYSRDFFYDDNIVNIINANEKIGSAGNLSNLSKWQKNISDKYYTKLVMAKDEIMFEFYRNKEFFQNLLEIKLDIKKPYIGIKDKNLGIKLPKSYAILFIGASLSVRKWSIENFAKIGIYLKKNYGYEIILCGGPSDRKDAKKFGKYFYGKYLNLVGKTSLVDLLYIIYNANLMITNETSAAHFAVALEIKKLFVIYNGNHYGRFTPYPKEITSNYHIIYHPKIEKNSNDYKKLCDSYGYRSNLDINKITIESIKSKIDEVMNN